MANILTQLLDERKCYEALFNAVDDMIFDPGIKGYTEGYVSPQRDYRTALRAAFLAMAQTPVPEVGDMEALKALSAEELKTVLDEALGGVIQMRQKRIREFASTRCIACRFCIGGTCFVLGGTCVYRKIHGVPGHYVGDILENLDIIESGWDNFETPPEIDDLKEIDTSSVTIKIQIEDPQSPGQSLEVVKEMPSINETVKFCTRVGTEGFFYAVLMIDGSGFLVTYVPPSRIRKITYNVLKVDEHLFVFLPQEVEQK